MPKCAHAAKTCVLRLSWVALGRMCMRECISGYYFSPEWCPSRCPCMCRPWNSGGMWRKHVPRQSGGKPRKCTPRHSAWGQMCKWVYCGLICASERTRSGVCCCSGRGRMCRGMPPGERSRHRRVGVFICSSGDCIGLGVLAQSLARSIWISIFTGALAFNRADAFHACVSTHWAGFLLWGFSDSHAFCHFSPGITIRVEDIFFR